MLNELDERHFQPKVMPRRSLLKEFRKAAERGSEKREVQMRREQPVRVDGLPANEKSLEVNRPHRIL